MHPIISDNDVVWTTTKDRYRSSDAELLESGLLADAKVRCVRTKRTWKVHKAILCSRSKWFKKALTGKAWKEGRTGVVEISEIPEYQIDLVLNFIYTGVVQLGKHFLGDYTWVACMDVWKLADFFCLEELQELSTKARDAAALHWAKSYASHLSNKRPTEFPPEFIKAIIYSITALYEDDRDDDQFREAFKSHLLGTAIFGVSLLLDNDEFKSLIRIISEFAVDWSLALMHITTAPTQHYRVGTSKPLSMAEKKGPALWALTQDTFQNTDLDLLTTGLLADAQVKCGDRTWNVHKTILCTRSEWFKKALLGTFEEGKTGKVTLTMFAEDEVDCLLHFLYVGSVDFKEAFPDMAILVAIIKTCKLADFFCLDKLHELLTKALKYRMENISRDLCSNCPSAEKSSAVDRTIKGEILPAIRALYQDDVGNKTRDTVLQYVLGLVIATMPYLESRKDFGMLFRKIPQFAVDWATAFMGGLDLMFPNIPPGPCAQCKTIVRNGKGTVDCLKLVKYSRAKLLCSDCFRIPTIDDWESF